MRRHLLVSAVALVVLALLGGGAAGALPPSSQTQQQSAGLPRILTKNPIYRAKALKDRPCPRANVALDSSRHLRQYYRVLNDCLTTAWRRVVKRSGLRWRAPKLVVWAKRVSTPCGRGTVTISMYCDRNETMYLNVEEIRDYWAIYPNYLGGQLGYMRAAFVLAHEYGHHLQTLMGTWRVYRPSMVNRMELQASCFSMAFLKSIRATFPIPDYVMPDYQWRLIELASHGTAENQKHWTTRGWDTARAGACNTYAAPRSIAH